MILDPTKGRDQVKASIKFGSQYGCGDALYCLSRGWIIIKQDALLHTHTPDSNVPILVFDNSSTIVINIQVVWRTENGDDGWEFLGGGLAVHGIAIGKVDHELKLDNETLVRRTLDLVLRAL